MMKRCVWVFLLCLFVMMLGACGKKEEEKKTSLEFTVVDEDRLPEEVKKLVEEKKEQVFKFTFADSGYLYLCIGYGKQKTGGYSVTVNDLYATENAIYVDTSLLGPSGETARKQSASYPYLVLKTPFMDKAVVFD